MKQWTRSLLFAASLSSATGEQTAAETLRILAASSLTESFRDIASLYREENPGADVELNFAGSQVLRVQIEEGAAADVFASADPVPMDSLETKGIVDPPSIFASNRLVVVTPNRDPRVRRLADLARRGVRIAIADANVPVGRYTAQVLGKMNRTGLFGDDFQKRFLANVVSQETNVRAVLAKVSWDEVDAGIVYSTDARAAPDEVNELDVPEGMNVTAEYVIAVLEKSENRVEAERFVALILGEKGQALLEKRGFQGAH